MNTVIKMNEPILKTITNALTCDQTSKLIQSAFYSEQEIDPASIMVTVDGVGGLNFPLDDATLETLIAHSSQAKFGLRERTLLDKSVRDCQEIAADQLHVRYGGDVIDVLKTMQRDLGIPEEATLSIHLHNLLVYGPGQFFKSHQDSEKINRMVATCVMVLPSAHIGGTLTINHMNNQHSCVTQTIKPSTIKCITFYADCEHEVLEVQQGYRVSLTFNVVLEPAQINVKLYENKPLESAMKQYFLRERDPSQAPYKFAYFLDHAYTEHSLQWDLLKGHDRKNALAFRCAAENLGLIAHLALAEQHESWGTDGDDEDPKLQELYVEETTLAFLVDENSQNVAYRKLSLPAHEIAMTTDTDAFTPFDTQAEGWLGNYGNTMDYWYRRAAIVLWCQEDHVFFEFTLNYTAALQKLSMLTHASGNAQKILTILSEANENSNPPRKRYGNDENHIMHFTLWVQIAIYLNDSERAHSLLSYFDISIISCETVNDLLALQKQFGLAWCSDLLDQWHAKPNQDRPMYHDDDKKSVDTCVERLMNIGIDQKIVNRVIQAHHDCFKNEVHTGEQSSAADIQLNYEKRSDVAKSMLLAARFSSEEDSLKKVIAIILACPRLYPVLTLIDVYLCITEVVTDEQLTQYKLLHDYMLRNIENELKHGLRSPLDWSITTPLLCLCPYCVHAAEFLTSQTESRRIWPLAERHRRHVEKAITYVGLPVHCSVHAVGSPHKFVMEKREDLYACAQKRYALIQEYHKKMTYKNV
jgi:hypothetical protein